VVGGVQQHRDLLGGQGAVRAAVHGQDVLGSQPTGFVVLAAADDEAVVERLDLVG
jgi:hypothetical protein